MKLKNLFRSKKQVESLKSIGPKIPGSTKLVMATLKLSRLQMTYNITNRQPFGATIVYHERPTDWGNQGQSNEVALAADSWSELVDKVIVYFDEQESSDPASKV